MPLDGLYDDDYPREDSRGQAKDRRRDPKLKLRDEDFLAIVKAERRNAVGMEPGDFILEEREKALEYFKGQMDDVPALPNRSRVVSSDVADAVYTVLPDLVEIFMGGEELGSFRPIGEEDVEPAKQETEVVNHVIMAENDGFKLVHDTIHDALLTKVGVAYAWAEEETKNHDEQIERQPYEMVIALQEQGYEVEDIEDAGVDEATGAPLFSFRVSREYTEKCVKVEPVPPEDFAVARDTKSLRDTTYCVMRTRPRAQDLKMRGFDPEVVDALPTYSMLNPQLVDQARDLAGEHRIATGASEATHDLRSVIVHTHIIRVDADGDGEPEIWRVDTDQNDSMMLQKERLNAIPFAAGVPYRMPHRFYGRSLADLLLEIQRIKTTLQRAALDSAYFALNMRHEVAESGATENTISDLLNNLPGAPVRVKQSGTIQPLNPGQMGYDPFEALEYFSTVAEQRSGITRNAQGLNPDTLHDTAKGAMALITAAQRRVRMIARVLAETLFKDLFVVVHGLLREHGSKQLTARLRNQWIQVDPTTWGVRKDMTIEIGMGGGREYDLMLMEAVKADMDAIVQAQGGIQGPVVTAKNVFALAVKRAERAGLKGVAEFYSDPEQAPPQEPVEDPQITKAKMDLQLKQAEMEMKERHTQLQFQKDMELANKQQEDDKIRAQVDAEDKARKHELEATKLQLDAENAARQHEIERIRLQLEMEKLGLERERISHERETRQRELDLGERDYGLKEFEANTRVQGEAAKTQATVQKEDSAKMVTDNLAKLVEGVKTASDTNTQAVQQAVQTMTQAVEKLSAPRKTVKRIVRGPDGRAEGVEEVG